MSFLRKSTKEVNCDGLTCLVLKRLENLNSSGRLILTRNILERLQLYLNEEKVMEAINYPREDQLTAKGESLN